MCSFCYNNSLTIFSASFIKQSIPGHFWGQVVQNGICPGNRRGVVAVLQLQELCLSKKKNFIHAFSRTCLAKLVISTHKYPFSSFDSTLFSVFPFCFLLVYVCVLILFWTSQRFFFVCRGKFRSLLKRLLRHSAKLSSCEIKLCWYSRQQALHCGWCEHM